MAQTLAEPCHVLEVLNILTTPKPPGTTRTKADGASESQTVNSFDCILEERLCTFEEMIYEEKWNNFRQELGKTVIYSDKYSCCVRQKYAETCIKCLQILEKSLAQVLVEFRKRQDSQTNHTELKPSQAPPLSPDTLSIAQQKTVLTTMQFISVLGISPYLQKGVGIPVERKSEFGKIISLSGTDANISDVEKRCRLFSCVQVLMSCINCTSLGALILSRNLNDLLAALLQLVYGYVRKKVPQSPEKMELKYPPKKDHEIRATGIVVAKGQQEDYENSATETMFTKGQQEVNSENKLNDGNDMMKSSTEWTPATVVDLVRKRQKSEMDCESVVSCDSEMCRRTDELLCSNTDEVFTTDDMKFCEDSLQLILDMIYQPMLVRELMVLQGGPSPVVLKKMNMAIKANHGELRKWPLQGASVNTQVKPVLQRAPVWLRKICGKLLTDLLMKPNGVMNVLKGMLEGEPGTEASRKIMESKTSNWRKCDAVAKVISSCPMKAYSVEEYYKMVAPQILDLIHYPDKKVARQFLRVACSSVSNMMSQNPDLTLTFIINPVLKPLLTFTEPHEICEKQNIVVHEKEISLCVEDIHRVFVSGLEPHSPVMRCLKPVCHVIFHLYCFTKEGVSHLRSECFEILVTYLKQSDKQEALTCLKGLVLHSDDKTGNDVFPRMHYSLGLAHGSDGGVMAVTRSLDDVESNEAPDSVVESILDILVELKKEELVGDFFLYMLQDLTKMVSGNLDQRSNLTNIKEVAPGEELLDVEAREGEMLTSLQNQVIVLNLLAAVCEKIGPSCIKNTKQTLNFVQVTLERAVYICKNSGDEMTSLFESETLTMAMGLLTAVLGGAVEVKSEDREQMKDLLPMLQVISEEHPESTVQEMASDLRVAIATHGVIWSELMKKSTKPDTHEKETKMQNKPKPLIEVIPEKSETTKVETSDLQPKIKLTCSTDEKEISEVDQAFKELCDPLIPVRGHALISLAKLVQIKHPDALDKQEVLLKVFMENLSHPDSYLYLASINGLAGLADIYPDAVIPKLVQEFISKGAGEGNVNRNAETRMKIGECLVKTTRNLGDMVPKYRDVLLAAILTGAKDPDAFVRASSISNLGEMCKLLRFSLGSVVHEVFDCCSSLLKSDIDAEVRKAAAMTICLLLQGLGKDTIKVLDSVIRDLYKLLKFVMTVEKDEKVKLHVTLALNELDTTMRELLFPKQTLQKKIKVLDPD